MVLVRCICRKSTDRKVRANKDTIQVSDHGETVILSAAKDLVRKRDPTEILRCDQDDK
jgi:hypothetical protein